MTMEDLEGYKVEVRRPSEVEYRGKWRLVGGSAPSSGGVVLSVMKIVEGFEMGSRELGDLGRETHLLDEAVKFGYGMVSWSFLDFPAFGCRRLESHHTYFLYLPVLFQLSSPSLFHFGADFPFTKIVFEDDGTLHK